MKNGSTKSKSKNVDKDLMISKPHFNLLGSIFKPLKRRIEYIHTQKIYWRLSFKSKKTMG